MAQTATSSAATSAATSTSVSRVTSLEQQHGLPADANTTTTNKKSHFAKLKKRLAAVKKEWGPGLAAKDGQNPWDDEYNFPAGRWAGQGLDPSWWRTSA